MEIKGALITHKCLRKHANTLHRCTQRQVSELLSVMVFQFGVLCVINLQSDIILSCNLDVYASDTRYVSIGGEMIKRLAAASVCLFMQFTHSAHPSSCLTSHVRVFFFFFIFAYGARHLCAFSPLF